MQTKIEVFENGDVTQLRPSAKAKSARERKRVMRAAERTIEDIEMEVAGIIKVKSTRGIITDFSYPARSRSKKEMRTATGMKTFVTMTFHDSAFYGMDDPKEIIKKADQAMKQFREWLAKELDALGFVVRHLKIRKSKRNKGRVVPHYHLLIDQHLSAKKIKRIIQFWIGVQVLPGPYYEDLALNSDWIIEASAIKNKGHLQAVINYMCKSLCPKALKALNGISIGRSFYEIGQPVKETPILKELSREAEAIFRRQVRKYMEAKIRRYSVTGKKRMSRALKLHMTDPASGFTIYMDSKDLLRLYDLAVSMAKDAPEKPNYQMAQAA